MLNLYITDNEGNRVDMVNEELYIQDNRIFITGYRGYCDDCGTHPMRLIDVTDKYQIHIESDVRSSYKDKYIELLEKELLTLSVYCNDCEYDNKKEEELRETYGYYPCEDCHRKYMQWKWDSSKLDKFKEQAKDGDSK